MSKLDEIKAIIPHREPFLLIDEIVDVVPGKTCHAIKYVKAEEEYFKGHFPGTPVMPGVLILESIAQSGAVSLMLLEDFKGKIAYFTGANNVKFRRKVVPGDKLVFKSEVITLRSNFGVAKGKAFVDDKLVCEAEISFMVG